MLQRPGSWGDKAVRAGRRLATGSGQQSGGGWTDRRLAGQGGPPSAGSQHPLAGQEARAAAELNEELPLTQPVGLHHLTEGLVGVAARVVADARAPQLREAGLAPATVPAGAHAAQAVLVTPATHFVGQARHLLWVEALAAGWHTFPVLEVEVLRTVNALFSAGPHAGSAGVVAFPTLDQLGIKVGARFTVGNAAAPCQAEPVLAHGALLGLVHALLTARVAFQAMFLTFIGVKPGRTEGHTGVRLLVVIEAAPARQALRGAPARARLTSLVAAAAASRCGVPKVAQRARADALPAGLEVAQAEVHAVQALVCTGAVTALVATLRMAHTGL